MAEFYVTYARDHGRCLALVTAPDRPPTLQFASRADLHGAMDALGHPWQLQFEMPGDATADWLGRMAQAGALKPAPRPPDSIFAMGSFPQIRIG
jgi:hypothetical protein